MNKRVIIIHGWGGSPKTDFLPWAKKELENKDYEVIVSAMPDSENPRIESWVPYLANVIGKVRETDILIGHSIGCQAILRFLQTLNEDKKVDRVILVAGWVKLKGLADEEKPIADSWEQTPIEWGNVKDKASSFVAIFSDNDPVVPLEENRKVFEEKLGAQIIIEHNKGHFNEMPKESPDLLKLFH